MQIVPVEQIPSVEQTVDVPMDDPKKVLEVCNEMVAVCEAQNGIGLSAVQVGLPWKLFIVKGDGSCPFIPKDTFSYFLNCDYKPTNTNRVVSVEGCLSLRSEDGRLRTFRVNRWAQIRITGYRLVTDPELSFLHIDAVVDCFQEGIVFQHEADHHKGVLISDIGQEIAWERD